VTCILFVLIILGGILKFTGLNIFKFLNYFKAELSIVLGTASSDSVLPQIMKKLKI
jgi:aerobic C4-dicarboxylate transport protein